MKKKNPDLKDGNGDKTQGCVISPAAFSGRRKKKGTTELGQELNNLYTFQQFRTKKTLKLHETTLDQKAVALKLMGDKLVNVINNSLGQGVVKELEVAIYMAHLVEEILNLINANARLTSVEIEDLKSHLFDIIFNPPK